MKNQNYPKWDARESERLRKHFIGDFSEPRIIPPTTVYDHNREDHETDYDGVPLTWKENLIILAICLLGLAVIGGVIYLIAK